MWLDIAIAAVLATDTILMGYLGVHVTLHPAESPAVSRRYKIGFTFCAVLAVSLVIWQGIRNARGQSFLEKQITELHEQLIHTHIRFNTNAIVLATGKVAKFKIPSTMAQVFTVNGDAEFNVDYQNVGTSNSLRTAGIGDVVVTDTRPDLDAVFSGLDKKFVTNWIGDELVPQDHRFFTANSRHLSAEEINKLDHGTIGLYLVAAARFSDSTGDYQQEFCGWLQLPLRTPQLVWHGCGQHESEIKLK